MPELPEVDFEMRVARRNGKMTHRIARSEV